MAQISQADRPQNVGIRDQLVNQWQKTYRTAPPKGIKNGLLERSAAYHQQALKHGKLKPKYKNALRKIASGRHIPQPRPSLRSGNRLVREWHGKTYQVDVTGKGFEWNGTSFKSLSAVAKAITGSHWSGNRFFGV